MQKGDIHNLRRGIPFSFLRDKNIRRTKMIVVNKSLDLLNARSQKMGNCSFSSAKGLKSTQNRHIKVSF